MQKSPKALRIQIGFFGKRNMGKSSVINKITGQNTSIVSDIAGTTTDIVEKSIEIPEIGPVTFLDTAGIDDSGILGEMRIQKTLQALERTDIAVHVIDNNGLNQFDLNLFRKYDLFKIPYIIIINKQDENQITDDNLTEISKYSKNIIKTSALTDNALKNKFKEYLIKVLPDEFLQNPVIVSDIISPKDIIILVMPQDKEAPKGRIILPQVQILRELLDNNNICISCQVDELQKTLSALTTTPKLVITDSQVFDKVEAIIPKTIKLTSFSILFARFKGDLKTFYNGTKMIDNLENDDKVLICESCTHHQIEDDIATIKIPNLIKKYTKKNIIFEHVASHDFPSDIEKYKLIIHCGACMTNRKEILTRIIKSKKKNIPITNFGLTIAHCTGILERAIQPFEI